MTGGPARYRAVIPTPIGPLHAIASDEGLCALDFDHRAASFAPFDDARDGNHPMLHLTAHELGAYFSGESMAFTIRVDLHGTDFQRRVWRALRTIPAGETRSYAAVARAIGSPDAVRAVGMANGANRIAIVVPCHRVIGSDGKLTGYGGGIERKRWLLEHEGALTSDLLFGASGARPAK